jgi:hypothetical protein
MEGGGAPVVLLFLCSDAELVVKQFQVSKQVNTEAEEATTLEAVPR